MIYGDEDNTITDDIWTVPNKFYRLTSITMYIKPNTATAPGFEVTFSPDPEHTTSGWNDVVHMFGNANGFPGTTWTYNKEITEVAVCVDKIWPWWNP